MNNVDPATSEPFPIEVQAAFLTISGAEPFQTIVALKSALQVLYHYRESRGLEVAIANSPVSQTPDITSCSSPTQTAAHTI